MSVNANVDWQDDKLEGVLAGVTFDDENDLFEDMLTVATDDPYTVTDINVDGAAFKDLHDKDADGQYNRTVNSLSALADLIKNDKVNNATLYMNVSKDGAVTIFVTSVTDHAGGGSDVTAPALSTATIDGTSLVLTYNENLDTASVPAASDFTVTGIAAGTTVSTVAISGKAVTLTMANAAVAGDSAVKVSYTPGANKIQDAAGNAAAALTNQAVTNNTGAPSKTQITSLTFDSYTMATAGSAIQNPTCSTGEVDVAYEWAIKNESGTVTAGSTNAESGKTYVLTATVTVKAANSSTHELGTLTAPTVDGVTGTVSNNVITFEFAVS